MTLNNPKEKIIEIKGLKTSYKYHTKVAGKDVYQEVGVLFGIDLFVQEGEIVALLGANGSGKTTLMHSIMGLLEDEEDGRIIDGQIIYKGKIINGRSTEQIFKLGITLVPEGALLFPSLSVRANLELGTYAIKNRIDKETRRKNLLNFYNIFPPLKAREKYLAGRISGGEARMVSVARGFLSQPHLLLLDEPCLGLAPIMVKELMNAVTKLRKNLGTTILLAEQNTVAALSIADRAYILKTGEVVGMDYTQRLKESDLIKKAYLGDDGKI